MIYFILGIYQYFDTITSFVQCVLQTFLESEESSKKNINDSEIGQT